MKGIGGTFRSSNTVHSTVNKFKLNRMANVAGQTGQISNFPESHDDGILFHRFTYKRETNHDKHNTHTYTHTNTHTHNKRARARA
jgi:hypothetical protein